MSEENVGKQNKRRAFSRRLFMKGVSTSVITASAVTSGVAVEKEAQAEEDANVLGPDQVPLKLNINGETYNVKAEPRETLLEVLRNRLDITGPKLICDSGNCGGCTVDIDGKIVYACMMLAMQAQGKKITTVEGLAEGENLHPVQEAFVEADALQCGYCTPGFVMSMAAVYKENPAASLEEVKEGISGNLCRCGTYTQIFEAAELAKKKIGG